MLRPRTLNCIRCGASYPPDHYDRNCPACAEQGVIANLSPDLEPETPPQRPETVPVGATMWRFDEHLPVPAADAVSLGEGGTPLVAAPDAGLGDLWIKDESRNPTWSFKDRLASSAVSAAKALGASMIVSSSSGNAGASAAAYAARAGLPCLVLTFQGAAGPMITQMKAYGAMVAVTEQPADRWALLSAGVERFGWFPTSPFFGPTVGSNPYGVEGYKTIAYEIAEQSGWDVPDWVVLPVCYGDALFGLWKGFDEMVRWGWIDRMPRLVAAEVSGSLQAAMDLDSDMPPDVPRNAKSVATSIDVTRGTAQAVIALKRTEGAALRVSDDDLLDWQKRMAGQGIFMEPSCAAAFAAIDALRRGGTIADDERAVAVMTASGLKDPARIEAAFEPPPLVPPDLDRTLGILKEAYGFDG